MTLGDDGFTYFHPTPLMSAIDQNDVDKWNVIWKVVPWEQAKIDILDMKIIAGHRRFSDRMSKKMQIEKESGKKEADKIDHLKSSGFEKTIANVEEIAKNEPTEFQREIQKCKDVIAVTGIVLLGGTGIVVANAAWLFILAIALGGGR